MDEDIHKEQENTKKSIKIAIFKVPILGKHR